MPVPDVRFHGAGFGQQVSGDSEAVAQIGEVGVDAIAPGITKGFDLFRFAGDMTGVAVFDISTGGGPLEVGVEFDAVRWIKIDALHLAAQAFAFCQ